MLSTNDGYLLGQWYPEQQMAHQYPSPFSLSTQADLRALSSLNSFSMDQFLETLPGDPQFGAPIFSELPDDILGSMTKLPSYRSRWVKLSALVKWKAMLRASKRARLML
uniref:Uncharacterized protein n=1 Tax=Arundo donax TaxID=35708 RepID=A0A0A8XQ31_ARUDO